jgi:hypothetical protein
LYIGIVHLYNKFVDKIFVDTHRVHTIESWIRIGCTD